MASISLGTAEAVREVGHVVQSVDLHCQLMRRVPGARAGGLPPASSAVAGALDRGQRPAGVGREIREDHRDWRDACGEPECERTPRLERVDHDDGERAYARVERPEADAGRDARPAAGVHVSEFGSVEPDGEVVHMGCSGIPVARPVTYTPTFPSGGPACA